MKRSKWLKLSLMGAAGASLTGCGSDPQQDSIIFANAQECIDSGLFEAQECHTQYEKAKLLSQADAPRYAERRYCETDFGYNQCQNRSGYWSPFMQGFMMSMVAHAVAEGVEELVEYKMKKRLYRGGLVSPLYRSSDDYFHYRTAYNQPVGRVGRSGKPFQTRSSVFTYKPSGKPKIHRSAGKSGAKATTLSRGGFGKSASARGGWGG